MRRQFFHEDIIVRWHNYNNIRPISLGANTPWPTRADAAVHTFNHHATMLIESVRRYETTEPGLKRITVNQILKKAVWASNTSLTYGGVTPLEIAT